MLNWYMAKWRLCLMRHNSDCRRSCTNFLTNISASNGIWGMKMKFWKAEWNDRQRKFRRARDTTRRDKDSRRASRRSDSGQTREKVKNGREDMRGVSTKPFWLWIATFVWPGVRRGRSLWRDGVYGCEPYERRYLSSVVKQQTRGGGESTPSSTS